MERTKSTCSSKTSSVTFKPKVIVDIRASRTKFRSKIVKAHAAITTVGEQQRGSVSNLISHNLA